MTKSKRTHPLDRDGDGAPGGSLPGNETAPMAETSPLPAGLTPPAEGTEATGPTIRDTGIFASEIAELVRTENTAQEIMETYPDLTESDIETAIQWSVAEAQKANPGGAATQSADDWTRNDAEILEDLQLMDEGWSGTVETLTLGTVKDWSDEQAREAQAYAASIVGIAPEKRPPAPDFLQPFLISKPQVETPPVDDADGDTFTAEEIAAGRTPVVEQEGEATTTAADQTTTLDAANPLATVQTETAPIAVRLSELQVLTSARRLYQTREGYSATWNAPFIDAATVDGWVAAGLAEAIPSAGNTGGVRATEEGRRVERQLRREQAQAEAA